MSGMLTVFRKELADYITGWRGIILFAVVLGVVALATQIVFVSIRGELTETTQFVFLKLFTTSGEAPFPFLIFIVFFVPIVGIALGFDAINSERNSGTLSRLLSQPIYRDAVINGKFLAGIVTIAIMLVSIIMLVSGVGLYIIGVPPSAEEVIRLLAFLGVSIVYGAFWLGLAMLFSILFRRVATSALAAISIWIFLFFFWSMITGVIAGMVAPVDQTSTSQELIRNAEVQIMSMNVSPIMLFQQSVVVLLAPGARTAGQILQLLTGAGASLLPNPLSLGQSLLSVWPHLMSLIALTIVCFAISYIKFMREEIRST